ncbi:hypothetical protein MtrunA17_Chr2g0333331 [Medicago truncatula]|uniref:Uncharacterized protein n=1 Tax=Medicago truncatula TaxID=3880 RepID=A0A396JJN8_MEDTR|nr:hypothetical protein MtrunA17_Chr2g0333331 [Medicago truncatula]
MIGITTSKSKIDCFELKSGTILGASIFPSTSLIKATVKATTTNKIARATDAAEVKLNESILSSEQSGARKTTITTRITSFL